MKVKKSVLLAGGAAFILSVTPLPYVIEYPGPTLNTLSEIKGQAMISVSGHQTYPTNGELDLVTIMMRGGPGSYVNAIDLLAAWISPQWTAMPSDAVFPNSYTADDAEKESQAEMTSSQDQAFAAALNNLKIPFTQDIIADQVPQSSPAYGKIKDGDVLKKVGSVDVTSLKQFRQELGKYAAGKPVPITVLRAKSEVTVSVVPQRLPDELPLIGVLAKINFHFPFEAKIHIDDVGGPSAGMMFALGTIDKLDSENLTGGKHIAGTGAISQDGEVIPIGGVRQKMISAKDAGAGLFLVPADNCDEVIGHIPSGLKVVKVSTLDEAKSAVIAYANNQNLDTLPVCTPDH
ncbi:MAG: PDZ domain-containing protein [Micrococcaceae bacterium]